ncbi:MAG: ribbon-helix-helix domain-containing protein, partial [Candidatus Altiarchaeota archaeon]|nr:ribbon-helix-helix domain-containing protein [Candidatus Altiarchaeota archaeon]
MSVISVSLGVGDERELDKLVEQGGFKGRSDAVRTAIKLLSREHRQHKELSGKMAGALVLIHDEKHE